MAIASQYVRSVKKVYPAPTQSGIAAITTISAIANPEISESVSVEKNVASATNSISESVSVEMTGIAEDFTTYTEVDPNSRITVITSRITVTGLTRVEDAYVYKDMGSGYFSGDFEHLLDVRPISCTADWGLYCEWGLANAVGALFVLGAAGNHVIAVGPARYSDDSLYFCLWEYHGGTKYEDNSYGAFAHSWDTPYYLTIARVGSVLTCKIYSDGARTNLLDTLTLTLHAVTAYRYIYGTSSDGITGTQGFTGYVELLRLMED